MYENSNMQDMRKVLSSKICKALSLPRPGNLAVTVRTGKGIEKCIKNKGYKKGEREAYFCGQKEKYVYIS